MFNLPLDWNSFLLGVVVAVTLYSLFDIYRALKEKKKAERNLNAIESEIRNIESGLKQKKSELEKKIKELKDA